MKYEQNIVYEDGGYVGYLLQHDEVVYFTPKCRTANSASERLAAYLKSPNKSIEKSNEHSIPITKERVDAGTLPRKESKNIVVNSPFKGRCCGRS